MEVVIICLHSFFPRLVASEEAFLWLLEYLFHRWSPAAEEELNLSLTAGIFSSWQFVQQFVLHHKAFSSRQKLGDLTWGGRVGRRQCPLCTVHWVKSVGLKGLELPPCIWWWVCWFGHKSGENWRVRTKCPHPFVLSSLTYSLLCHKQGSLLSLIPYHSFCHLV